jgi:hypothetical protein
VISVKKLLCSIVGHQPPVYAKKGWYSPGEEYGKLVLGVIDGTGRQHAFLHAECARCGTVFMVARVHVLNSQEPQG